jgi:hypothetical protein
MVNASAAPGTGSTGSHPIVYLSRSGASTTIKYEVQQALTGDVTSVSTSSAVSASTWYYVALGQYPTPTSSYPYQQTLWISLSTTSAGAKATQTITYADYGKVGHFMIAGMPATSGNWEYGAFRLDQLGVWARYLMDSEIGTLVNSGSGKAYPFY